MKIAVIIFLTLLSSPILFSQENLNRELENMISHVVKDFPDQSELSFAFVTNDSIYFKGIRKSNSETEWVENKNNHFEIGSLTKVFTATLLSIAHFDNDLKLEQNINKALPFKIKDKNKISYKSLANHTSGLPRMSPDLFYNAMQSPENPYKNYSENDFEKYLQEDLTLENKAGEKYVYSNTGYGLLANALSHYLENDFDSLLHFLIFEKYNMSNTTFSRENVDTTLVKGRDKDGFKTQNWEFNALKGAGGIYSTTSDLSKFATAHLNSDDPSLTLTKKKTFDIKGDFGIGLAWHIIKNEDDTIYWHNGGTGGYTSSFSMNNDAAVIILSNISALGKHNKQIDPLCFELLKKMKSK